MSDRAPPRKQFIHATVKIIQFRVSNGFLEEINPSEETKQPTQSPNKPGTAQVGAISKAQK